MWQRATAHDFSAELAQGRPAFGPARDVHKQALKLADPAHTLAVETIVVGGAATDLRLVADGFINGLYASHVGTCASCGQPEDLAHRYYRCTSLASIPDPHGFLSKSEWVLETKEAKRHPLFWARGLVPGSIYDRDDDVDGAEGTAEDGRDPPHLNLEAVLTAESAVFAADGGGAPREVPSSVARVGAAAVAVGLTQGLPTQLAMQPLRAPGRQTIPRAEAWAYVVLAKRMNRAGCPTSEPVVSDASYVVGAARSSGARASWSTKSDI